MRRNIDWLILSTFTVFCFFLPHADVRAAETDFKLGIEVLGAQQPQLVRGKRIALLTGSASYDQNLDHVIDRLSHAAPLEVIFTGEPYFRSLNSEASSARKIDALTNAPVMEILDPLKKPSIADLGQATLIVVDVQDIGIRYYSYITLLAQFLDLSRESGIPIVILDRPNPIGGMCISGPVLNINFRSKFGVYPIPLVYGMTFGELALLFNKNFGLAANLTVVGMEGYNRNMRFQDCGTHWFPVSDHLPEADSPSYYAITGFLGEMGVFSTGVGTPRPFHYILAPWMDGELMAHRLSKYQLPGVKFVAVQVKTFYGLFQQKKVPGVEIVIEDVHRYDPVTTGLAILKILYETYPDRIPLATPALAEAIDTLLGGSTLREAVAAGKPLMQMVTDWQPALREFRNNRQSFLIYPEN